MTKIIGICGIGPKSGKSEAARIIWRELLNHESGYFFDDKLKSKWDIKRFAEGPKEIVSKMTGIPTDALNEQFVKDQIAGGWEKNGMSRTIRELIISVSEGLKDSVSPDIWVDWLFQNKIATDHWIIDDVRFVNEVRKIRNEDGILIRINRNSAENGDIYFPYQVVDYEVDNNGSIEQLQIQLIDILKIEELI